MNIPRLLLLLAPLPLMVAAVQAEPGPGPRTIKVFVALCDNEAQGIVPVPARIGNGDQPEANLYWGCSDGLASYFKRSSRWQLTKTESKVSDEILVRLHFKHRDADLLLTALAYRGTAIKACVRDFEAALASGKDALVAYLGHNGLMDFALDPPAKGSDQKPAAVVLCCKSEAYFRERITALGGQPILLTDQFMYPGSFLLHDAVEAWRQGKSRGEVRTAAGRAYARNQKISVKAATGVFSKLDE